MMDYPPTILFTDVLRILFAHERLVVLFPDFLL